MSISFPLISPPKRGIALGSGGAKGIIHLPVLLFFEQRGVKFHALAGSSMGALVGAVYLCGNLKKFSDRILSASKKVLLPLIEPVFPRHGLLATGRIRDFLSEYIPPDKKIEDLPARFCAVATDYDTGDAVLLMSGNLLDAVCASVSIPGIFVPVRLNGRVLIDGGVANPVPVDVARAMGANRIVAVNCHPHVKRKGKTRSSLSSGHDAAGRLIPDNWFSFLGPLLKAKAKNGQDDLPTIFDVFSQTLDIMEYKNTIHLLKHEKPSVIIEPDVRSIDSLEFERGVEIFAIARAEIERNRRKLDRFCRRFF